MESRRDWTQQTGYPTKCDLDEYEESDITQRSAHIIHFKVDLDSSNEV